MSIPTKKPRSPRTYRTTAGAVFLLTVAVSDAQVSPTSDLSGPCTSAVSPAGADNASAEGCGRPGRDDAFAGDRSPGPGCPPILYVRADAAPGGDGLSWDTSFAQPAQALLELEKQNCIADIWVAAGIYVSTAEPRRSLRPPSGVRMFGGFTGDETDLTQRDWRVYQSILSGESLGPDSELSVVVAEELDQSTVLDGFVIEGGGIYDEWDFDILGGGVRVIAGGLTLRNCTLRANHARLGSGIYVKDTPPGQGVTLLNCRLLNNACHQYCTFEKCPKGHGGGLYAENASVKLVNTLIAGNRAAEGWEKSHQAGVGGHGGGIFFVGSDAEHTLTMINCTLAHNEVGPGGCYFEKFGGGLICADPGTGGGLWLSPAATATLNNCIFWESLGGNVFGSPAATSSAFYPDAPAELGIGSFLSDPSFQDPTAGDYHLAPISPCRNTGDTSGVFPGDAVDLDGHLRVQCGRVDMGAYESGTNRYGDLNGDDVVSLADYRFWDACLTGPDAGPYYQGCQPFDFDTDGDVDLVDFGNWQQAFGGD